MVNYMKNYIYPAVFQPEEKGYSVWMYDFNGCFSQGDTLEESVKYIKEAFGLTLEHYFESGKQLPTPTLPNKITLTDNQFVSIIDLNFQLYLEEKSTQPIELNITIPAWLNKQIIDKHLNISRIVENALIQELSHTM
jgi:predicted RNase H-like HicB family nuclease